MAVARSEHMACAGRAALRRRRRLGSFGVAVLLSACAGLAACGSEQDVAGGTDLDEPGNNDDERDQGDTSPIGRDEDPDIEPAFRCDVPYVEDESEPQDFERLTGQVLDEQREPVPNTHAQACAVNVCIFGTTDELGFALVPVPDGSVEAQRLAFKYGDGLRVGQFARLLDGGPEFELGVQRTLNLTAGRDVFEPGETVSSAGVELSLVEGTSIELDLLTFPEDEAERFVAGTFADPDDWPEALSPMLERGMLIAVVGVGPLKTSFCPAARLSVPMPDGAELEPGTPVDFYLHITDTANAWGLYGDWAKVSSGYVSDDGEHLVTADDEGIPQLGMLAVVRADD